MPFRPQQPQKRPGKKTAMHDALRAQVMYEEDFCGRCGKLVDKTLPGTHDWGPTLGHILPVREHPELEFDRSNAELQHSKCNKEQGSA